MKRIMLVSIIGLALAAVIVLASQDTPTQPRAIVPSPTPTATPDQRTIPAIRAHPITPSAVTTVTDLPPRGGCATSIISYSSDGNTVRALLQVPSTLRPANGYPILILLHGYITPATYRTEGTDYQDFIDYFCANGYAVIKPDFRGHGQSTGEAMGGNLQPSYSYDVMNLVASLPNISGLNATAVALLGHSMGGAVALRTAVASHDLPIDAYIMAGGVVGSLEDIAYKWPRSMLPADIRPQRSRLIETMGSPEQNPTFWHDASSINYVDAITAPVQIHHGDADAVVPIFFSEHLDRALTTAGKPHEYYIYPGGDHQFLNDRAIFLQRSLDFLDTNLK